MSRVSPLVAAVILSVSIVSCGDSGSGGGTPMTATPTVNGLSISGLDAIRTGLFGSYSATATFSNGTTQTVTPIWTSSHPDIASVDAAGRLDGNAHGSINLSASYQGRTASKNVNVVHNFGGAWTGTYQIRACDQAGVFSQIRWCQELGGVGSILEFGLALTQSGAGGNVIGGTLALGSLEGNISGNVTADGRLVLGGPFNVTADGITFTMTIGGWDTRPAAGDSMTGGWAQNLNAIGVAGNAYQENRIVTVTHTAPQITPSAAPDRHGLSLSALFARLRGN